MSLWVLLVLKLVYRNKLNNIKNLKRRDINLGIIARELDIEEGKLRRRIFYINLAITGVVLFLVMMVSILIASAFSYISTVSVISNYSIMSLFNNKDKDNKEDESSWSWKKSIQDDSGLLGYSGLYPKDRKLRLRAELLEVLNKSAEDAGKANNVKIDPAHILGGIYRETGNSLFNEFDRMNISSIFKDLVVLNPACGKGSSCSWIRNGYSHYYGGKVVSGADTGNPYKDVYDISESKYNTCGGNHALGVVQFEIPYIYTHLKRVYKDPKIVITNEYDIDTIKQQSKMDNNLGFIRPNIHYIPDALYNKAFTLAIKAASGRPPLRTDDFKKLSEKNQACIRFIYASAAYGRGHANSSDDEIVEQLIQFSLKHPDIDLDKLLINNVTTFWNSKEYKGAGMRRDAANIIRSKYSLDFDPNHPAFYGIYAINVGRIIYDELVKVIQSSEKLQIGGDNIQGAPNGNWVGRPGSGRYGNNGSKYYLASVGIRWYHQTHNVNNYSEHWGSIKLNGLTRSYTPYQYGRGLYEATMGSGGCGIYTIAMIASNLLNKDITPDIVRNAVDDRYVTNCLTDAGVDYVVPKLGLNIRKIDYTSYDAKDKIIAEIKKGNMILFVGKGGPMPWYDGEGHFMALRGITDDGKLLGITSTGNNGKTAEELMKIPIDYTTWYNGLSRNRNYVWVIGLN